MANHTDTIAAIVTPPGHGGVAIIRICGAKLESFITPLLAKRLVARYATYSEFLDIDGQPIDIGIAIYFPSPNSYTGEDTLELQAHGGPVVMDRLLKRVIQLGARQARPGEFSERAFLNGKIDLVQAEAVADLISASTEQAARGAIRSLKGEFSGRVNTLLEELTVLRVFIEAAIDFSEEEIDFLGDSKVSDGLEKLIGLINQLKKGASQGVLLGEGFNIVIAGAPNAGKSSLLNALLGQDRAIVSEVPGTTRDIVSEQINIDGLLVKIIDTAGLRSGPDTVEQEGIRRAWLSIADADSVLWVVDGSKGRGPRGEEVWPEYRERFPKRKNVTVVINKIDLIGQAPDLSYDGSKTIFLSAVTGQGINDLKDHLKSLAGFQQQESGSYSARRRHLTSLDDTENCLVRARGLLAETDTPGELVAEELRLAQQCLGQITGVVTNEDLLGKIFSSFCIGK